MKQSDEQQIFVETPKLGKRHKKESQNNLSGINEASEDSSTTRSKKRARKNSRTNLNNLEKE
jgi:hypothetical protein